jgi:hypothetical protein
MVSQQLLDYIKQQLQLGKNKEAITRELLAGGWQQADIDSGFASLASGVPAPMMTELPPASQIFKQAWDIYKNRFKTLVTITLIPAIATIVLVALGLGGFLASTALSVNRSSLGIVAVLIVLIAIIFLVYVSVWSTIATIYVVKDPQNLGFKQAYKISRPKINPFFSTGLLSFLAVVGGSILVIIPGIIFALWFSQSGFVVIDEDLANTAALKRSKYYVKGRLGQVFGKSFYIGIISLGIYIIVAIVISGLNYLVGSYFSWLQNLFSIIWAPLATAYGYLVYKYLRATRP